MLDSDDAARRGFLNLRMVLSVNCDCAGMSAVRSESPDLGILGSAELASVERASMDMVFYAMPEQHRKPLVESIASRKGPR